MNDPNETQVSASESTPSDQGTSEIVNQQQGENVNTQPVPGPESPESSERQASPSDAQSTDTSEKDTQISDDYVWDGNSVDDLPKPLQARAKGMLRHLTKVTQEAAQVKRFAEGYHQIVNHPEFKEFLEWKETKGASSQPSAQPATPLTEEELLAAQGDPEKFHGLLQQSITGAIQPYVQQFKNELAQIHQARALEQSHRSLNEFATKHPDFWEVNPVIMKSVIQDLVVKQGKSLDEAYKFAKHIEKSYDDKAQSSLQAEVAKKKNAVSATPTKNITPNVVYARDKEDVRRLAFKNAVLGKQVDVRIKK